MSRGVLESWLVKVTVWRRGRQPLSFGLAGRSARDILGVAVQRRMNEPGRATVLLPGRTAGAGGERWSDLISPMDVLQIDATVRRNPDRLSRDWRTIFFGYVDDSGHDLDVGPHSLETNTPITASDSLGVLASQSHNYWMGTAFTGGPNDEVGKMRLLTGASLSPFALNQPIALALKDVFHGFLYPRYQFECDINGAPYTWQEMHGLRLESDNLRLMLTLADFAPQTEDWLSGVKTMADAPRFYEVYSEIVPAGRLDDKKAPFYTTPRTGVGYARKSSLMLPGNRMEAITVRPLPHPVYDPAFGFDAVNWANLNHTTPLEEVGVVRRSVKRRREGIKTVFSTMFENIGPNIGFTADVVLVDWTKYLDLVGYQPWMLQTRRGYQRQKRDGTPVASDGLNVLKSLTYQQFSYFQYADRFYSGTISAPVDLDAELGIRLLDEDLLYYLQGYSHQFVVSGNSLAATTNYEVSRGLPLEVYNEEYPKHLGRQRPDEKRAPQQGLVQHQDIRRQTLWDQGYRPTPGVAGSYSNNPGWPRPEVARPGSYTALGRPVTPADVEQEADTPYGRALALAALAAIDDPNAPGSAYQCSAFVRYVFQDATNSGDRRLFATTDATATYQLWSEAGLVYPLSDIPKLRVGDVLFKEWLNNAGVNQGHVGIYVGGGYVAENSVNGGNRPPYKKLWPLARWGKIIGVGRIDKYQETAQAGAGYPPIR